MLPSWLCCCELTFCSPSCFGSYLCRWPLPLARSSQPWNSFRHLSVRVQIWTSTSEPTSGRRNAECSPRRQTRTKRYSMNYDTPSEDSRQEILIPRQDKISTSREHMREFESRRQKRRSLSLRSGRGFCDPLNLTPFFAVLWRTRTQLSRLCAVSSRCAFDKDCKKCHGMLPQMHTLMNHALSF